MRFVHDELIVSADDKGVLKLWTHSETQACISCALGLRISVCLTIYYKWREVVTEQAHKNGIASLAVHERSIITGASDGNVKVWSISEDEAGTDISNHCSRRFIDICHLQ